MAGDMAGPLLQEAGGTTSGVTQITAHWAIVPSRGLLYKSASPPAQETNNTCRQQTRTKLLSPRLLVLRKKNVSAVSF